MKSEIILTGRDSTCKNSSECYGLLELTGSILKNEILILAPTGHEYNLIELVYPFQISKNGKLNVLDYKDESKFTLANSKNVIISLKSVMKLMLMMTKTDIAKEFRNFVLDELVLGETAQEIVEGY